MSADSDGQVSEVDSLAGAGEEIQPDQSVAGAPEGESGAVQEGEQGPNARTGDEDSDAADTSTDPRDAPS